MKHLILAETETEFHHYHTLSRELYPKIEAFLAFLQSNYAVLSYPNTILWTSVETATRSISTIPLPSYTNEFRTVFCPDPDVWQEIYLQQFIHTNLPEVSQYYKAKLTNNHILQILGHEFVHHSNLFIDDAYEKARWFEEGMCEYISRKYFLTDREFLEQAQINRILTDHFRQANPVGSLESFTANTYNNSIAAIFFEYWRSFLAVQQIIYDFHGNIPAVFHSYHIWHQQGAVQPLSEWFHIVI